MRYIAFHERILQDKLNSLLAIALNNQDQSITLALPNWKNYQLAIADGSLKISLKSPPIDGKANLELIFLILKICDATF